VGGNPFETTCIYSLIHFLERKWKIHFAMGGTGARVDAMEKLMREQGISIHLNTTITSIPTSNGRAIAVHTENGDSFPTDLLVSNIDPLHLYRNILGKEPQTPLFKLKQRRMQQSMGLFVLFFGTDRQYP
jgi:phytoene desaturase